MSKMWMVSAWLVWLLVIVGLFDKDMLYWSALYTFFAITLILCDIKRVLDEILEAL